MGNLSRGAVQMIGDLLNADSGYYEAFTETLRGFIIFFHEPRWAVAWGGALEGGYLERQGQEGPSEEQEAPRPTPRGWLTPTQTGTLRTVSKGQEGTDWAQTEQDTEHRHQALKKEALRAGAHWEVGVTLSG